MLDKPSWTEQCETLAVWDFVQGKAGRGASESPAPGAWGLPKFSLMPLARIAVRKTPYKVYIWLFPSVSHAALSPKVAGGDPRPGA